MEGKVAHLGMDGQSLDVGSYQYPAFDPVLPSDPVDLLVTQYVEHDAIGYLAITDACPDGDRAAMYPAGKLLNGDKFVAVMVGAVFLLFARLTI